MAKTKYADRFAEGMSLINRIRDEQVSLVEDASDSNSQTLINMWVDLAKSERSAKQGYRGRYLFELIQNANDAIVAESQNTGCRLDDSDNSVCLSVTSHSLLVANRGRPFTESDVRAICRLYTSTKDASKQIGHKGIGFKSVLEITERPEVYSNIYAFGFDGEQFRKDVDKAIGTGHPLDQQLPILRYPFPRYLNQLNPNERERIERFLDDDYVTVVRLPFSESKTAEMVNQRLHTDLQASLLLFLPAISQIEIGFLEGESAYFYRTVRDTGISDLKEVILYKGQQEKEGADVEDSRWLVLGPIHRKLTDRQLVADLGDAWKDVEELGFSFAFPLQARSSHVDLQQSSQPFFVYFPTQEYSGLRFIMQADFHVRDDRKHLDPTDLNKWLVDEACAYLAGAGIEKLKQKWPKGIELIQALSPLSQQDSEFATYFRAKYLEWLSISEFVPTEGGHYRSPVEIRIIPSQVDEKRFRELFPADRLRGEERWAYPAAEIIRAPDAVSFLKTLGAKELQPEMVIRALTPEFMSSWGEKGDVIAFLADWWANLPSGWDGSQRQEFESALKKAPVFRTSDGWMCPNELETVYHANLTPNVRDITTPAGFEFAILLRSIYPAANATRSNTYRLLDQLGARDYSARNLIRDSILPVLVETAQFDRFVSTHPDAIIDVYQLLYQYFLAERSKADFSDRLSRVPVPAYADFAETPVWKPAGDCYLGSSWPGGSELELIFGGLRGSYFLADIHGLNIETPEERTSWRDFFVWLGVMDRPRVSSKFGGIHRYAANPFSGGVLWDEYLEANAEKYQCTHPENNHGMTRELKVAHTIYQFSDLVQTEDPRRLLGMYQLLARIWQSDLNQYSRTEIACRHTSTRCPSESIEDYLLYQLRNADWLPAQIHGKSFGLHPPRHIWILSETELADARDLLPTLPLELRTGAYQAIANDLGFMSTGNAKVEDYVELLHFLPDHYPANPDDLVGDDLARWHRSLRAVFNWICEHIQTGLVSRGSMDSRRDDSLRLLGSKENEFIYLPVTDSALVWPDDKSMAKRWAAHFAFLPINDDWIRFRGWLEIKNLSDVIESKWIIGEELHSDTSDFREKYRETLPYFLAVIQDAQPANYPRILSRLRLLRIHIVESLEVHEKTVIDGATQSVIRPEQIYLNQTMDPNPGRGMALRSGNLYISVDGQRNPYLMADVMAGYIEIARLGDSFVILLEATDGQRRQYLSSKGIDQEVVKKVALDLQDDGDSLNSVDSAPRFDYSKLLKDFQNQSARQTPMATLGSHDTQTADKNIVGMPSAENEQGADKGGPPPVIQDAVPSYPDLDFTEIPDVDFQDVQQPASSNGSSKPISSGVEHWGNGHIPSEKVTKLLGDRGERWAYETEKARLRREYGLDPDQLEREGKLAWISRERPLANHDILSLWRTDNGEEIPIYIEVKASSGSSPRIKLSRSEIELAFQQQERYWLYWIANIDTSRPDPPRCFQNFAQLISDNKIILDVDTLAVRLPIAP